MAQLTKEQIEAVIQWMNEWDQLKDTVIPLRFKEAFNNDYPRLINKVGQCSHENIGDDWETPYCLDCRSEISPDVTKTPKKDIESRFEDKYFDHPTHGHENLGNQK